MTTYQANFLNMTPIEGATKKIDFLDLIKNKKVCAKRTLPSTKMTIYRMEEVILNHISSENLVSRIYK